MQQTTGRAALVQNNIPPAVSIASTSNTTPITLASAVPHRIKTNDYLRVTGAADSSANGDWIAGTVTGTTVVLLVIPGGGNSVATGGGGAAGTVRSLGYGITVPVPNDLTDAMRAGGVNVPFEAGIDREAYLLYRAQLADDATVALAAQVPVDYYSIAALTAFNGITQETLTGSGAGAWQVSTVLAFTIPQDAIVGDVVVAECIFQCWLHITGPGSISPGKCKIEVVQDFAGANVAADVPGSTWNVSYLGAGVGTLVQTRLTIGGQFTVATAGPLRVRFTFFLANTEYVDVMGDGFLRASIHHVGV